MTTNTVSHDVWSTPLTPLAFLGRAVEVFPDREAVVYGERRMTYTQLSEEVTRVAHALRACGVNPGDRVAYLMPNIPEMLVAQFAVPLAGGVLVAINTRLAPPEVKYILAHCAATVLVVDAALHDRVESVLADLPELRQVVTVLDPASGVEPSPEVPGIDYAGLCALGSDDPLPWTVQDERSTISINYTSGDHGSAQGRHVPPSGRLLELSFGDHPFPARIAYPLFVDAADVPLQRLVHRLGGHGHRRDARLFEGCRCRGDLGPTG